MSRNKPQYGRCRREGRSGACTLLQTRRLIRVCVHEIMQTHQVTRPPPPKFATDTPYCAPRRSPATVTARRRALSPAPFMGRLDLLAPYSRRFCFLRSLFSRFLASPLQHLISSLLPNNPHRSEILTSFSFSAPIACEIQRRIHLRFQEVITSWNLNLDSTDT